MVADQFFRSANSERKSLTYIRRIFTENSHQEQHRILSMTARPEEGRKERGTQKGATHKTTTLNAQRGFQS